MILMRDYYRLYREGIDLFNLTEETARQAFVKLKPVSLSAFVYELRYFLTGAVKQPAPATNANGQPAVVNREDVAKVLALVPNWESLTWAECVELARAKIEHISAERSFILCAIHNAHITRRIDAKTPADFNPIEKKRRDEELKKFKADNGITPEIETKRLLTVLGGKSG